MIPRIFIKYQATLQRWFSSRYWPLALGGIGVLLTLPAIGTGWVFDDYWHNSMFSGRWPWRIYDGSLLGLFSFADGTPEGSLAFKEVGIAPWWAFDGIKAAFWRPLTEVSHWLDYQLWPDAAWAMHIHSLIWFGLTIWIVAKVYRRIIGPAWIAGLAGLLFAVDNTHMLPATFIANRNTLIAACFGSLALLAHIRRHQDAWRAGLFWGPLCYTLALFSKESALAIGAYVFSYTVFLDHRRLRQRLSGFLPYVVITLAWLLAYRHLGFGTQNLGDSFYIDPARAPLLFLKEFVVRLPIYLLAQFSGPPAEAWAVVYKFWPYGHLIAGGFGLVILSLLGLCVVPLLKRDAAARFWTLGMLCGLLPVCAAFPSSRLLFFAGIGAMSLLARLLAPWFRPEGWPEGRNLHSRATRLVCMVLALIHLALSPLSLPCYTSGVGLAHYILRTYSSSMPYPEDIADKTVVLVNPPTELLATYSSQIRAAHGEPVPARVRTLGPGELSFTLTRVDPYTLEIASEEGLLSTAIGNVLRGPSHPMHIGQQIRLSGVTFDVLELLDGWQPSRIRARFSVPLENPSLLFLRSEGWKLVPARLPAIGETHHIPAIRGWIQGAGPGLRIWDLS